MHAGNSTGPLRKITAAALLFMFAGALLLGGCEQKKEEEKAEKPPEKQEKPVEKLTLEPVAFTDLPGWADGSQAGVVAALVRSCAAIGRVMDAKGEAVDIGAGDIPMQAGDWKAVCAAVPGSGRSDPSAPENGSPSATGEMQGAGGLSAKVDLTKADDAAVRAFLEANFDAFAASAAIGGSEGLFTGYFEAELHGSLTRQGKYETPLYGLPDDLVQVNLGLFSDDLKGKSVVGRVDDGKLVPYPERDVLQGGWLNTHARELVYVDDPVDAFLLQVQGSGRVVLDDGSVMRVGFAAHNGRPYKSIGRWLIDEGELEPHEASWDGIRNWLEKHPDRAARLFAVNPRYVFFRKLDGDGPIGAQGVALTPKRSMAVDTAYIPLGSLLWLDTTMPGSDGAPLRTLLVAQDKGGAIKGPVRGDFFWGYGDEALAEAGRMKSRGRYYVILPKATGARILAHTPQG